MDQNRLFFRIGLRHMFNGHAHVASVNGAIRGYVHFNESPYCLPAPEEIRKHAGHFAKAARRGEPKCDRLVCPLVPSRSR